MGRYLWEIKAIAAEPAEQRFTKSLGRVPSRDILSSTPLTSFFQWLLGPAPRFSAVRPCLPSAHPYLMLTQRGLGRHVLQPSAHNTGKKKNKTGK